MELLYKKQTTEGWYIQVEWKDRTNSLMAPKESNKYNPISVYQYVVENHIVNYPYFNWWASELMMQSECLIGNSKGNVKSYR